MWLIEKGCPKIGKFYPFGPRWERVCVAPYLFTFFLWSILILVFHKILPRKGWLRRINYGDILCLIKSKEYMNIHRSSSNSLFKLYKWRKKYAMRVRKLFKII